MVVSERSQPSGNFPSTIPAKKAPCKLKESISLSSEAKDAKNFAGLGQTSDVQATGLTEFHWIRTETYS